MAHARTRQRFTDALPVLAEKRGLSLRAIAKEAGLDHSYLAKVLRGDKRLRLEHVDAVASALDLPGDYFPEQREAAVLKAMRADPSQGERIYDGLR